MREAIWDAEEPAPAPSWECVGPWQPSDAWMSHGSAEPASYQPLSQDAHSPNQLWVLEEETSEPLDWRGRAEALLTSVWFQAGIACLIVANAVVIGVETDSKDVEVWDKVENAFLVVFSSELILKLVVLGFVTFFDFEGPDFWWNSFDFVIVALGILDFLVGRFNGGGPAKGGGGPPGGGGVATVFRIIRLLRILRIFRIVKFLKQLYMLAFGFALAAVAVSWVTFLMFFVLYVCSIVLVRTVGHAPDDDPNADLLHKKFGSIIVAMFTLFEIMASPSLDLYEDVIWDRPCMAIFIILFIIFGSFGMIALLTGVISESMFDKNNLRLEEERTERENTRKLLVLTCEKLFDDLPSQTQDKPRQEGAFSSEVLGLLPQIAMLFESENINYAAEDLFCLLDVMDSTGSGTITREEFKFCIVQMAEGVRPLLIMRIYYAMNAVRVQTGALKESVRELTTRSSPSSEAERVAMDRHQQVLRAIQGLSERMDGISGSVGGLTSSVAEASRRIDAVAADVATLRRSAGRGADPASPTSGGFESAPTVSDPALAHTNGGGAGLLSKVRRGMGVAS